MNRNALTFIVISAIILALIYLKQEQDKKRKKSMVINDPFASGTLKIDYEENEEPLSEDEKQAFMDAIDETVGSLSGEDSLPRGASVNEVDEEGLLDSDLKADVIDLIRVYRSVIRGRLKVCKCDGGDCACHTKRTQMKLIRDRIVQKLDEMGCHHDPEQSVDICKDYVASVIDALNRSEAMLLRSKNGNKRNFSLKPIFQV